jgi:RNA polymerase sigma factor (sigma-70 family)
MQLSLGACALEAAAQLGLSEAATREFTLAILQKAKTNPDIAEIQLLLAKLYENLGVVPEEADFKNSTNNIIDLEEFRLVRRGSADKKPVKLQQPKKIRRLKEETPYLATRQGMSDEETIDYFLPSGKEARNKFIHELSAEIRGDLSANREADNRVESALVSQTSRGMVLLTRAYNHFSLSSDRDEAVIMDISRTTGLFITRLQGYVYALAKKVVHESSSLTLEDLIAEGQIGLIEALGRFDLGMDNIKFFTYARKRIHGAVIDASREKGSMIRQGRTDMDRVKRARELLYAGKTVEETAQFIGISVTELEGSLGRQKTRNVLTLDAPTGGEDSELHLGDTLLDPTNNVEDIALGKIPEFDIEGLIDDLRPDDAKFIRMRFGLYPYDRSYRLSELGAEFGYTESRASQVNTLVLDKLYAMMPLGMRFRKKVVKLSDEGE